MPVNTWSCFSFGKTRGMLKLHLFFQLGRSLRRWKKRVSGNRQSLYYGRIMAGNSVRILFILNAKFDVPETLTFKIKPFFLLVPHSYFLYCFQFVCLQPKVRINFTWPIALFITTGEHSGWSKHTNFHLDTNAPILLRVPGYTDSKTSTT